MFGLTVHNRVRIQPIGDFLHELEDIQKESDIAYGVIFVSGGAVELSVLRYVRNADDFGVALDELRTLITELGADRHLVTDSFCVAASNDEERDSVEKLRGVFEYTMGLHNVYPTETLVPREQAMAQALDLALSGSVPEGFLHPLAGGNTAPVEDPAKVVQGLLDSLKGKSSDDFQ